VPQCAASREGEAESETPFAPQQTDSDTHRRPTELDQFAKPSLSATQAELARRPRLRKRLVSHEVCPRLVAESHFSHWTVRSAAQLCP